MEGSDVGVAGASTAVGGSAEVARKHNSDEIGKVEEGRGGSGWPASVLARQFALSSLPFYLSLVLISLTAVWGVYWGGGLGVSGIKLFNLHPLLTTIGFLCLQVLAIPSFRSSLSWLGPTRDGKKRAHFYLLTAAGCFGVAGVMAAVLFHSEKGIPHLYSVHSVVGILALLLFLFQLCAGYITFWMKSALTIWRWKATGREWMNFHRFFGSLCLVLTLVAVVTGWMDKQAILNFVEGRQTKREMDVAMPAAVIVPLATIIVVMVMFVLALPKPKARADTSTV